MCLLFTSWFGLNCHLKENVYVCICVNTQAYTAKHIVKAFMILPSLITLMLFNNLPNILQMDNDSNTVISEIVSYST